MTWPKGLWLERASCYDDARDDDAVARTGVLQDDRAEEAETGFGDNHEMTSSSLRARRRCIFIMSQ